MTTDSIEKARTTKLAPMTLEFYPIMGHGGRGQKSHAERTWLRGAHAPL